MWYLDTRTFLLNILFPVGLEVFKTCNMPSKYDLIIRNSNCLSHFLLCIELQLNLFNWDSQKFHAKVLITGSFIILPQEFNMSIEFFYFQYFLSNIARKLQNGLKQGFQTSATFANSVHFIGVNVLQAQNNHTKYLLRRIRQVSKRVIT